MNNDPNIQREYILNSKTNIDNIILQSMKINTIKCLRN